MKIVSTLLLGTLFMIATSASIYDFKMKTIEGKEISLDAYKGKVLLVVNTASKCGYTPQYEGLQSIYKEYQSQGLEVLGFPANNFMGQEPGSDEQIKEFCTVNFNVEFPMFSKVSVKGKDQHPLFVHLTSAENPDFTGDIKWNFEKILIGKDGKVIRRFRSQTKPDSKEVKEAIELALKS
jgi:glutathione peroxidase